MPTEGFVYVATGPRYLEEARRSAAGLRRHHPARPVCLVTERAGGERFWDDLIILERPRFGFRDKLEMRRCPYDRFVFLDADTEVAGDLGELFIILANFDACGIQAAEGQDYKMEGIPHAFPEMNGGMLGFRKSPAVGAFFDLWEKYYDEFFALNRDGHRHYANVGDQKSLRAALWHSSLRWAVVGSEFNFIPFKLDFASLPVKVLHTRAAPAEAGELFARLNGCFGRRVYSPILDAVVADDMKDSELRRIAGMSARLLLRRWFRRISPLGLRNRLRRLRLVRRWFMPNRFSDIPPAPAGRPPQGPAE